MLNVILSFWHLLFLYLFLWLSIQFNQTQLAIVLSINSPNDYIGDLDDVYRT